MIAGLLAVVFLSSFYASDAMFAIVDIFLGICGVINCLVMFKLAGRAFEAYKDYRAQRAAGKETPVFSKSCLSDSTGVNEWE
jgi:AGCS family alanine or glycine:cation symporter